jgi:hypothetical protein
VGIQQPRQHRRFANFIRHGDSFMMYFKHDADEVADRVACCALDGFSLAAHWVGEPGYLDTANGSLSAVHNERFARWTDARDRRNATDRASKSSLVRRINKGPIDGTLHRAPTTHAFSRYRAKTAEAGQTRCRAHDLTNLLRDNNDR